MMSRLFPAALALVAACATSAAARDLTIAMRESDPRSAVKKVYLQPFAAATDVPIQEGHWDGGLDGLRAHKEGEGAWDVISVRGDALLTGCDEGLFEKLDWSTIGGKDHYVPAAVSDCGVGSRAYNYVLAWDRDKFPGMPAWADFWDVAKYPGKRGLLRGPRTNLEIALLADGVAPGDVYKALRTNDGLERAFRKLDQIKPYAVWWDSDEDATRILGSGEVLMTSAASGRTEVANREEHRNFGVQWTGSLSGIDSWAVMKGSANLRHSQQFLYFAGSSAIQARFATIAAYAGLAKGATEGFPPEVVAQLPLNPANQATSLPIDEAFWRDNLEKLSQRFAAWLSR